MTPEIKRLGEIPPISNLTDLDGGKIFDEVQKAMAEKFCLLVGDADSISVLLLFNAAKLLAEKKLISQQNLCANCNMRSYCIAQNN